jgi:hypothetical protein
MTTVAEPSVVSVAELGPRERLNAGANGTIHLLRSHQVSSLPGPLVFKEYRLGAVSVSLPGLQSIIAVRNRMPAERRDVFDNLVVWPLRVVVNEGVALGVLMRLISDDFWEEIALPSGRLSREPREVQHLIFDPGTARMRQVAVPADDDLASRLRICARLAYALAILHGANLVYGDLSARNVLYRLVPTPSTLLVDCDAVRVRGTAAVNKQQDSPDWDPPETAAARAARQPARQTQETDRYKLALFILRCLTPGRGSSLNRDWSRAAALLDPAGAGLMRAALEGPARDRPKAREWLYYLRSRLGIAPLPPPTGPVPVPPRQVVNNNGWRRAADGTWVRV